MNLNYIDYFIYCYNLSTVGFHKPLEKKKFMLAVKGIYQNGQLILEESVPFIEPVAVIVTFLEEQPLPPPTIDLAHFSFSQSRELLKEVKSSLSDTLIAERRESQ